MITKLGFHTLEKAASISNVYAPYDVENADLIDQDHLEKLIRNNMASKASDTPTGWGKALGVGGGIGALTTLPSAYNLRTASPLIAGGLLGMGAGALLKYRDDRAITRAKDDNQQFTTSPEFRSLARANASGRSLSKRMQDAQYNALAKNDAARERHQNLFGTQQMRRVI